MLNSAAKIGTAFGIALIPAIGAAWMGTGLLTAAPGSSPVTTGYQVALGCAAIVALLAIPVAWLSFREEAAQASGSEG
jgi:hypothetical protein